LGKGAIGNQNGLESTNVCCSIKVAQVCVCVLYGKVCDVVSLYMSSSAHILTLLLNVTFLPCHVASFFDFGENPHSHLRHRVRCVGFGAHVGSVVFGFDLSCQDSSIFD
jgi:hypothetical protein